MKLEIEILAEMMEEEGIPHINLTEMLPTKEIVYTPYNTDHEVCSIIQNIHNYDESENFLETTGLNEEGEENLKTVINHLSAQEVFKIISKHWDKHKKAENEINTYEIMYVHKLAEKETIDKFNQNLKETIEKLEGTMQKNDIWGVKELPFEIENQTQGIYGLVRFECSNETIKEIDKKLKTERELLRHMIIRL